MKTKGHSIQSSCRYFGKSRQGYYERMDYNFKHSRYRQMVLDQVMQIRKELPKCGTRKLHYLLQQSGIKIGRDKLFEYLREANLLIKRKRKYVRTTHTNHAMYVYDNLIKDVEISHAEEVFVSDINYIRTGSGFCYLAIVGDAYSKKIMGKFLSKDMKTTLVLKALVGALQNKQYNRSLIHHSDRGVQYQDRSYINALKLSDTLISMSGKGKAWENPVAERIMGILKQEFGLAQTFKTYKDVQDAVDVAIRKYNTMRPHSSCGYLTPQQAHEKGQGLKNLWKKKLSTY